MIRLSLHLLLIVLIGAVMHPAAAQEHAFVPVNDWTYTYVERLQHRGYLLELNPSALPYTRGAVKAALRQVDGDRLSAIERRWLDLLNSELGVRSPRMRKTAHGSARREVDEKARYRSTDRRRGGARDDKSEGGRTRGADRHRQYARDNVLVGVSFDVGMRSAAGERLDVLRPTGDSDPRLEAGLIHFPNAGLHGYVERGHVIARGGVRFDMYYQDDPDGLDAANRLSSRNNESYLGYNGRFASIYLGRIGRHWAPNSEVSTMLSRNPVSVDQIAFRIGGDKLSWRGLLGELDSATLDGRFTGAAGADSLGGSIRRHLAVHRVDWRPSKHFGASIMEASLYSSSNGGISLKFLNPLLIHLLAVDGRPKNDENNGLVAGSLWAQFQFWTLFGQLMLDDFDILGETGEPASAALSGSLTYAGLSSADLALSATAVTARAYNTHQAEGRYMYLNRGLATQWNDFIHLKAHAALYLDRLIPGLTASPKIDVLLQGESDFRMPYPDGDTGLILVGTTERTIRPGIEMRLQNQEHWWIRMDVGPNLVTDAEHQDGIERTRWTFLAEFGARIRLNRGIRLSL